VSSNQHVPERLGANHGDEIMRDDSYNLSNKSSGQYSNTGANQSTFGQTGSQIMQQSGKNSSLS
jgi:hypothetical protein